MFKSIKNKYLRAVVCFLFFSAGSYLIYWIIFSVVASIAKGYLYLSPLLLPVPALLSIIGAIVVTIEETRS